MKLIKGVFWLLSLFVLVLVAGAAFLVFKVDPNDYKAQISQAVKEATGRDLQLKGEIEWSFSPWLGVTLNDFSLSNRTGFFPQNMVSATQAKVQVKLKPLLQQRVEIDQVLLLKPVAHLSINAQGQNNWADMLGDSQATESNESVSAGLLAGGLVVQGVSLSDGAVHWNDEQVQQAYTVTQLNLETGALISGEPTTVTLSALVAGNDLPDPLDFSIKTTAQLSAALDQLNLQASAIQVEMADVHLNGDIEALQIMLEEQILTVSGLALEHQNASLFPSGLSQKFSTTDILLNLQNETLDIPVYVLNTDSLTATGALHAKQILSELVYKGSFSSNTFSLRTILEQMEVDLAGLSPSALKEVTISSELQGGLDKVKLNAVQVQIDQSNISGEAQVNIKDVMVYRFDLEVDQLHLDEFISETTETKTASPTAAVVGLPVVALKGLDIKGQLDIGQFTASGFQADKIEMSLDGRNEVIKIAPLKAQLYQGKMENNVEYDLSSATPRVTFESSLSHLNLGPFLQAMDLTDKIRGDGSMNIKLDGAGLDVDQLISSLKGQLNFNITDGDIKGANIQQVLLDAASTYKQVKGKDVLADVNVGDKTEFSSFGSHFKIDEGRLLTEDIDLRAPLFRLTGRGHLDLTSQQIDLKLVAAIVESLEGQGGKDLGELRGEELPLAVSGAVASPKIRLDVAALLKSQLKREVEKKYLGGKKVDKATAKKVLRERLDEEKDKIKEKLKSKLMEKLFNF